jgi:mono/diheme cytochrome c family protein
VRIIFALAVAATLLSVARAAELTPAQVQGQQLFRARCGYCHLFGGTGTIMLARRLGDKDSLLENRADLDAGYIRTVVRGGLRSMPALTRVEVTDAELAAIAAYLTRAREAPAQ